MPRTDVSAAHTLTGKPIAILPSRSRSGPRVQFPVEQVGLRRAEPREGPIRLPMLVAAARKAPVLARRGETAYMELPCRSLLNRCTSERMPFEWTINPYRGCEFGCGYCYARYTHEFMGMEDTRLFETRIYAKQDAARALERDLSRAACRSGSIALGTATDPYQPAERRMKVTQSLLEVFARKEGLRLSITTKGTLVTRDIDLLRAVSERNDLTVNMTITTLSRRLARLLEPRAPRPGKRLEAVRELSEAGLRTGVFIMPVIPGITDAPASLDALVGAAARAGASRVAHQVLFLRDSARREFFPLVQRAYPRLAPHLRRGYRADVYYSADYRARVDQLMRTLRRKHGLSRREEATARDARGGADGAACVAGGATVAVLNAKESLGNSQLPLCF